jgi:hypothetical protein
MKPAVLPEFVSRTFLWVVLQAPSPQHTHEIAPPNYTIRASVTKELPREGRQTPSLVVGKIEELGKARWLKPGVIAICAPALKARTRSKRF